MIIVGITGTKGKSTTLKLINDCLIREGKSVAAVYTEGILYNNKVITTKREIRNYRDVFLLKADVYLVEATSAMLRAGYFEYDEFDITIFTSLEKNEHLEIHQTFEDYRNSKKELLHRTKKDGLAIVNRDISAFRKILQHVACPVITYGEHYSSDCRIKVKSISSREMIFSFEYNRNIHEIKTSLLGKFNAWNCIATFITLSRIGITKQRILDFLKNASLPEGRLERYSVGSNIVVIDYAHTPKSLENVIDLLTSIYPTKDIITVFGCGGDKSKDKRSIMGEVAIKKSKIAIVTSDNPRYEDPQKIIDDITAGITSKFYSFIDRSEAIAFAITNFENSVILLAGKGAEKYTIIRDIKQYGTSDKEILVKILSKKDASFDLQNDIYI